jgi:hypothetical protein
VRGRETSGDGTSYVHGVAWREMGTWTGVVWCGLGRWVGFLEDLSVFTFVGTAGSMMFFICFDSFVNSKYEI